ncbi:sh3 domain-binding glutamic acid-rich-like protein [Anaeramoeba flamelloides]|uniref:Sh3 domain-binding glutamic acid-rich-like protein n=1 Tax=Anaeramoeba flamelloides TaxID=1746091 RepID=A0ABQ8Z3Y7_9EUKA|nr:sh3 domain-binding glutamic acid-rich-like protein [Anaeramoeba flamelloides]
MSQESQKNIQKENNKEQEKENEKEVEIEKENENENEQKKENENKKENEEQNENEKENKEENKEELKNNNTNKTPKTITKENRFYNYLRPLIRIFVIVIFYYLYRKYINDRTQNNSNTRLLRQTLCQPDWPESQCDEQIKRILNAHKELVD